MMKTIVTCLVGLGLLVGCASKETSGIAREKLEENWNGRVGSATKTEMVEAFGNAEWCRADAVGEETCRFYKKKGTVWMGDDKRDKKSYEAFDEVVATFDAKGVLKTYRANAQR